MKSGKGLLTFISLKTPVFAILIVLFLLLSAVPARPAEAVNIELLVRPFGMGRAFTAVADDAAALIYNPAGLSQSSLIRFMASGGLMASDVREYGELLAAGTLTGLKNLNLTAII